MLNKQHYKKFYMPECDVQVIGKVATGDMFGEVGVLCYRPQPYTVRTTELCQILRLNGTSLMNIIQVNTEHGRVIMHNLYMVNIVLDNF